MKYYVYECTVRAKPNLSSSSKKVLLLGLPVLPPIIWMKWTIIGRGKVFIRATMPIIHSFNHRNAYIHTYIQLSLPLKLKPVTGTPFILLIESPIKTPWHASGLCTYSTYIHRHNIKKINTPTWQANLPHDGRGRGVSRSLGLYQGQSQLRGIKRQAELLHLSLKRILWYTVLQAYIHIAHTYIHTVHTAYIREYLMISFFYNTCFSRSVFENS